MAVSILVVTEIVHDDGSFHTLDVSVDPVDPESSNGAFGEASGYIIHATSVGGAP